MCPIPEETKPHDGGAWDQSTRTLPSAKNGPTRTYRVNTITYSVNAKTLRKRLKRGALVDRGANGGIAGRDMSVVEKSLQMIDLSGLQEHTVRQLPLVHSACGIESHLGPVIAHFHQQAYMPDDKSVISSLQLEASGCTVADKSKRITGDQPYVKSPDGYRFPLSVRQGLPYLDARPVRDEEWDKLPHTSMMSIHEWDPSKYDDEVDPKWSMQQPDTVDEHYKKLPYNRYGEMDAEIATAVTDDNTSDEEAYGEGALTVGEVEANLTELIADELVDSVIEFEVNGIVYVEVQSH